MRIVVGPEDLAATRFAISPVFETALLLRRSLRQGAAPADAAVRAFAFLNGPGYGASFAAPPPGGMAQTLDDDLASIAATPPEVVGAEVARVLRRRRPDPDVAALLRAPDLLPRLVAGVRATWNALMGPRWPRVRAVLERDVHVRAGRLAEAGWAAALDDMRPRVRWEDGAIVLERPAAGLLDAAGRGLLLIPSVFIEGGLAVHDEAPWRPAVLYPSRGAGLLLEPGDRADGPLAPLIGRTRAGLLDALAVPSTTTGLAALTGAGVGATGDHLKVLRDAGLVVRERQGRSVRYARTALGDALAAGR